MAFNVLIVDDSSLVRSVIGKTIALAGIPVGETFYAANGQEALDILNDSWIDIVFADINMPVMNGEEMILKMSEDGMLSSIPVVIVSTEGSSTRIDQLMNLGVAGYIRKPFTPEKVNEIFVTILGETADEK